MIDFRIRRDSKKSTAKRASRPSLEGLEDRLLLYAYTGDHFELGSRITWSIVPDGTDLGGVTSNLVSTLNQKLGAGNWEQAFQDAFAQWENESNVNVSQVSDNGAPTGSGNLQQGSPNFGDIRIGGYVQAGGILAYTLLPPPNNGGSDAGDIFFNTNQAWHINTDYDLETVAIHEIGHALEGLGESSNPSAAEYEYYNGIKQGLSQDDVNGAQFVWGPRAEDGIALGTGNFTSARAANITHFTNQSTDQVVLGPLDVASSSESYWFQVTTPANASNNLTVQIQSTNLSELSPKVQVYNASLQGLTQIAASPTAYGTTIDASINNATPGTTYYIHVSGSNVGASGTGAYAMTVSMGNTAIGMFAPPNTGVAAQPDQGGGGLYQRIPVSETIHDREHRGDFLMVSTLPNPELKPVFSIDLNPDGVSGESPGTVVPIVPVGITIGSEAWWLGVGSTDGDDDSDPGDPDQGIPSMGTPPAVGTPSILIGGYYPGYGDDFHWPHF